MSNYITPPETYSTTSQSSSSPTVEESTQIKSYPFVNDCRLELHSSPFLLTALTLQIPNTSIIGIGSLVPLLTMEIPDGKIYYQDAEDFGDVSDIRYKLFAYIDPVDNQLRIDFNRNHSEHFPNDDFGHLEAGKYSKGLQREDLMAVAQTLTQTSDTPDMVFKGEIPNDFPKRLEEPLFGILKFENLNSISNPNTPDESQD